MQYYQKSVIVTIFFALSTPTPWALIYKIVYKVRRLTVGDAHVPDAPPFFSANAIRYVSTVHPPIAYPPFPLPVAFELGDPIHWFTNICIHGTLGYLTPKAGLNQNIVKKNPYYR